MFHRIKYQILVFGLSLLSVEGALGRDLTGVEVYRRCYAQLTQQAMPFGDSRWTAIKAGTKTPLDACMEVLDKGSFDAATHNRLATPGDPVSLQVLSTMNQVHQTFFLIHEFQEFGNGTQTVGVRSIYDMGEPALFYTKALFDTTTPFRFVVTSNVNLRADRTNNNPDVSVERIPRSQSIFGSVPEFTWAPVGDLLGVTVTGNMTMNYTFNNAPQTSDLGATRGGGVLGTPTYLLQTIAERPGLKANSLNMPRKWAKSVFNDFLCRTMPAARLVDTDPFVDTAPTAIEFRRSGACTQCHASMDRMAAVNRNFKYQIVGNTVAPYGAALAGTYPTNGTLDGSVWPSIPVDDYSSRSTLGVLYYRDYKGQLINTALTSISDLGAKLAATDDFYICAAKKYYQYFVGVDVDVIDPYDGRYRNKGADMSIHKNNVVTLGLGLKSHQSLRTLIKAIFNLDVYKKSNLGIQGQ